MSKEKWINVIEKDMEKMRSELEEKIANLAKLSLDFINLFSALFDSLTRFIINVAPPNQNTFIAVLGFRRELIENINKLDIDKDIKNNLLEGMYKDGKEKMESFIKDFLRLLSFDNAMDILLRGLGKELVKKFVSSELIAEIWGYSALEKFNKL